MKLSLILLVVLVSASAVLGAYKHKKSAKWAKFKQSHQLKFKHDDHEEERFLNFDYNDQKIEEHNSKQNRFYEMGHNSLSHMTQAEVHRLNGRLSYNHTNQKGDFTGGKILGRNGIDYQLYAYTPGFPLPASFDWTQQGWTPLVKDQNPCGDCWAHSTTSAVEFQIWKKTKQNTVVSRQELTDCNFPYGNNGCNGGVEQYAFDYIIKNQINTETAYPFQSGYGGRHEGTEGQCSANKNSQKFKIDKYAIPKQGDEKALMELLVKYGPVCIGVDGGTMGFQKFKSGVLTDCGRQINHAVLLVGYGTENGVPFWKIMNSWGKSYGQGGFIKMTRQNDKCGIVADISVVPILN